jgi:hypothetical protein
MDIMAAFAHLKIPVDLTRGDGAAATALTVVANYPGTRNASVDAASSSVSFELIFPGNVSGLVRRLSDNGIPVGERATVSLPVRSLAPELVAGGGTVVSERLLHGAEVWDVAFDRGRFVHEARVNGDTIEASIEPSSNAMHQIYDALLTLGLVAHAPHAVA